MMKFSSDLLTFYFLISILMPRLWVPVNMFEALLAHKQHLYAEKVEEMESIEKCGSIYVNLLKT